MGHRAYPFEVGGPKRLTVSWDFFNSRYSIRLDDEDPVIVTGAEVREGRELTLSDGSTLLIRIADGNGARIFRVTEGGKLYSVRLRDLLKRGDITANVPMRPGDILIIPQSWF